MVDFTSLSDKQLRELLLKHEDNPPPVNANTRSAIETKLKRICEEDAAFAAKVLESQNEIMKPSSDSYRTATPPSTPPLVRFEPKPDTRHEYEREYTPSYCRKSLNEYRDNNYDSPKFNLLDRPGCTPHINKHEASATKTKLSKPVKSGAASGILVLITVAVIVAIGIYFLLHWDPGFANPVPSN